MLQFYQETQNSRKLSTYLGLLLHLSNKYMRFTRQRIVLPFILMTERSSTFEHDYTNNYD